MAAESSPRDALMVEEEPVEPPPSSNPVLPRPGHLWPNQDLGPLTPGDGGASVSVEAIHAMLHEVRRDVLLELKGQQEAIKEILGRLPLPNAALSTPARGFRISVKSQQPNYEKTGQESTQMDSGSFSRASPTEALGRVHSNRSSDRNSVGDGSRSRGSKRGKQNLFSTFSHYDLALQDVAERVEGLRSRIMFHNARLSMDPGDNKDPIVQRIVHTHAFDIFCALVVISNSIFLGVETEWSITRPDVIPQSFQIVSTVYACFFTLELMMRIGADGWHIFCNADWMWAWLDAFVVAISLWEVIADLIYVLNSGQQSGVDGNGVSSLRALRIVRITRVIRVARLMRVFRFVMAFRTLITSIAFTLKSLFWAVMLLFVIVYVFAVLFAHVVNDYISDPDNPELPPLDLERSQRYYSSLVDTMISLFMCIVNGVNWENVISPLRQISPAWTSTSNGDVAVSGAGGHLNPLAAVVPAYRFRPALPLLGPREVFAKQRRTWCGQPAAGLAGLTAASVLEKRSTTCLSFAAQATGTCPRTITRSWSDQMAATRPPCKI
ncbi:Scn11a [Symbiodinium natans]|uniref:Scn11a protein n=1 Tax=Symbiodinium natans TaxID=878477 RepID=A0A812QT34_9DINO|nr:Scn11a [Symbiodinium natans]